MIHKKWAIPFIALLFLFLATPVASAHVTLHPEESSTDAWEKYSVRIPVEKESNTTKVELKVPEGINLVSVMPKEDWDYELEQDENENITSVTWTAKEDGVGPNEFTEFYFIAANPSEAGEFSWEAFQTYDDGSVVDWDGEPDAEEPASVTKVVEGGAVAQHDSDTDETPGANQEDTGNVNDTSGSNNWLPITLSGAAILLALISLFRKRN